jgi:hypothetical protein
VSTIFFYLNIIRQLSFSFSLSLIFLLEFVVLSFHFYLCILSLLHSVIS